MMLCVVASAVVSYFISDYGVVAMTAVMVVQGTFVIIGFGLLNQEPVDDLTEVTV